MPASPGYYAFSPQYSPCDSPLSDISNSVLDSPRYHASPLDLSFSSRISTPSPIDLRISAIDLSVSPTSSPPHYYHCFPVKKCLSPASSDSSPTYCSTSDSSSYTASSPSCIYSPKCMSPEKYRPLSPITVPPAPAQRKRNLYNDYFCFSSNNSGELTPPPQRRMSARPTNLDYSPISSPVYYDSSPDDYYSSHVDNYSPISPHQYSPPYYPFSPQSISVSSDYSFSSPKYTLDNRHKSINANPDYYTYSSQYSPTSTVSRISSRYSPTYYPLSPQYTPTPTPQYSPLRQRKNVRDTSCLCCSPPPPKY